MKQTMEDCLEMPLKEVLPIIQDRIVRQTTYFGIETYKNPLDYWIYQEIIFEMKPDVIVEIGNHNGGSTLAIAHFCDLMNHGRVVGIDISHEKVPDRVKKHPRVQLIEGDACASFPQIKELIRDTETVLVIEDSSHTFENTLEVLRTFCDLVPPGGYFIVEDGICHHGLDVGPEPGPYEAVDAFVSENGAFEIDRSKESFLITWNPKGYLRRRQNPEDITGSPQPGERSEGRSGEVSGAAYIRKPFIPPVITKLIKRFVE